MAGQDAPDELDQEKPLDPAVERVRRKLVRFMVINLAILFTAVMAVVVALVYKSVSTADNEAGAPLAAPAGAGVPSGATFSGNIPLPAGSRILSHSSSGSRLTLHLRLADGSEAIHLFDLHEARPIGRYHVVPEVQ